VAGVLRAAPAAEAEGAVAAQGVGLPFAAQSAVAVAPGAAQGRPLVALHVEAPRLGAPGAGSALTALPVAVELLVVESSAVVAQELPDAAQGLRLVALHVEAPRLAAQGAGPALMAQPVAVEPPRVESSAVAAQVVPDADWAEVATLAALA
jgi:hypothetical protein